MEAVTVVKARELFTVPETITKPDADIYNLFDAETNNEDEKLPLKEPEFRLAATVIGKALKVPFVSPTVVAAINGDKHLKVCALFPVPVKLTLAKVEGS